MAIQHVEISVSSATAKDSVSLTAGDSTVTAGNVAVVFDDGDAKADIIQALDKAKERVIELLD